MKTDHFSWRKNVKTPRQLRRTSLEGLQVLSLGGWKVLFFWKVMKQSWKNSCVCVCIPAVWPTGIFPPMDRSQSTQDLCPTWRRLWKGVLQTGRGICALSQTLLRVIISLRLPLWFPLSQLIKCFLNKWKQPTPSHSAHSLTFSGHRQLVFMPNLLGMPTS